MPFVTVKMPFVRLEIDEWTRLLNDDESLIELLDSLEGDARIDILEFDRLGEDGKTPLMYAVELGLEVAARTLLRYGAYINAEDDARCWTPLMYACFSSNIKMVQLLLESSDIQINDGSSIAIGKLTAMHYACANGDTDIVLLLLQNGAALNIKDYYGLTPLSAVPSTSPDLAKTLIKSGADTSLFSYCDNEWQISNVLIRQKFLGIIQDIEDQSKLEQRLRDLECEVVELKHQLSLRDNRIEELEKSINNLSL